MIETSNTTTVHYTMKNFTRTNQLASRKSEEITATPERASSRVQGRTKLGRGDINSFALLQDDIDEEEEKDEMAMLVATEESGGDGTTENGRSFFRRYKTKPKSGSTEGSMGGTTESSSITPKLSALAKSTGTPGTVSFASTTGRNETELNKLKPTAKEKTGDIDTSVSTLTETEVVKKKEKRGDEHTDANRRLKTTTMTGEKLSNQGPPTTPKTRKSSSYAAVAGKEPIIQDQVLQGFTAVVTIIVKVNKGEDPKKNSRRR